MSLDQEYWNQRYIKGKTGWDIGYASSALIEYASPFPLESRILIPGAGNAYEWIELQRLGYRNCMAIDFSELPIKTLKKSYPAWEHSLIHEDFFEHEGEYDLILEQTFFCALAPTFREKYLEKIRSLLSADGKLAGLLFAQEFEKEGPPFGGDKNTYDMLFNGILTLEKMELCENSIPERKGHELFFIASKA
jgi:methyl halide transferase